MKYFVDGNEPRRIDGYAQWRIEDEDGNLLAMCYGPMSATVAATACRELNNETQAKVVDVMKFGKNEKAG